MAAVPFLPGVGMPELLLILFVVLLLFGPKRLPQLGKSLGKTMRSIKEGVDGKFDDDEASSEEKKSDSAKADSKSEDSSEDS